MTRKERALLILATWACVYPGVLLFVYGFKWLGIDVALWLQILVFTAFTVPLINLVALPRVEKLIAAARGETPAELKRDEARLAEGAERRSA